MFGGLKYSNLCLHLCDNSHEVCSYGSEERWARASYSKGLTEGLTVNHWLISKGFTFGLWCSPTAWLHPDYDSAENKSQPNKKPCTLGYLGSLNFCLKAWVGAEHAARDRTLSLPAALLISLHFSLSKGKKKRKLTIILADSTCGAQESLSCQIIQTR